MIRGCKQMVQVPGHGLERCDASVQMHPNKDKKSERWNWPDAPYGFCIFYPMEPTDYCHYHTKVREGLCKTK
jgi:hypothetical protein